jgi:hypothetical protein
VWGLFELFSSSLSLFSLHTFLLSSHSPCLLSLSLCFFFSVMNVLGFSPVDIHGLTEARLTILSQQLFLAKIAKEHLQQKLSNLLRLIFFDQGYCYCILRPDSKQNLWGVLFFFRSSSFLSLTEANNEISLVRIKHNIFCFDFDEKICK